MASKYELLKLINSIFNRKVLIQKDENMICDQTIIMSDQLKELAHIIKPIKDQIEDMKRRKENISQY
jgi:hypothetical protein